LRVGALVFQSVGHADASAIYHFDAESLPKLAGFLDVRRHDAAQASQDVNREAAPRLAISAGVLAYPARTQEGE